MKIARWIGVAALLPALAAGLAFGGDAVRAGDKNVEMSDDHKFKPEKVEVQAGDTVVWKNTSKHDHHVRAADSKSSAPQDKKDKLDSGVIKPGATYSYTFKGPGTFGYVCALHEKDGMKGQVEVKAVK